MRIVIENTLATRLKPEYAEHSIMLNQEEKAVLEKAQAICKKARDLQAKINQLEYRPEDYNDFGWAAIYLEDCLNNI